MNAVLQENHAVVVADDWRRNRAESIRVLQSSLYPGAKEASVEMVLGYCEAARLDPMQKPVHIVPMSVKTGENEYGDETYEKRDTVMPGIGLYRIQAARTGEYAGMEEPEYGPTRTLPYQKKVTEWYSDGGKRKKRENWIDATLEYPEWCKVTVYRLVQGARCPWTVKELWIENYATAGRNTNAPNSMWERRPNGQIAKCSEAQALRKAFPDAVGSAPTAEEMEGRTFEASEQPPAIATAGQQNTPSEPLVLTYDQAKFDTNFA
jgi:phage recombination protein Bet